MSQATPGMLPRRLRSFIRRQLSAAQNEVSRAVTALDPSGSPVAMHQTRKTVADAFLRGDGIEIGALHQPLPLPPTAHVKYVDRMTAADLRHQYEELAAQPLVETDIVDNGELLTTLAGGSQNFVVANHFIEHCQDPIRMLHNAFRVLTSGGVLYLAVPDKRFTFDVDRPVTTIDHVMRDFREGPEWSRRQHFEEWTTLVNKCTVDVEKEVDRLMTMDYSIHFHVWRASDLLELVAAVQRLVAFELELFLRNGFETILILRKASA